MGRDCVNLKSIVYSSIILPLSILLTMAEEKKAASPDSISSKSGSNSSDQTLYIVLAWLFAPVAGAFFMKDQNDMIQFHAKQSVSWGIVSLIGHFVCFLLSFVVIGACVWPVWSLLDTVVRIVGIVKGLNGEKWEVPVVGGLIK